MAFNKVILMGNMVEDPELKMTQSGVMVTSFRIAVERRFKNGNEAETDFITVVAWRSLAEFITKFFSKGKGILICGELQTRSWADNEGNKRYATEVVASEATFVGRKNESAAPSPSPTPVTTNVTTVTPTENADAPYTLNYSDFVPSPTDEDLPF